MAVLTVAGGTTLRSEQPPDAPQFFDTYCSSCHNDIDKVGSLSFDDLKPADLVHGAHADTWEAILRKVSRQEMPPRSKAQPDPATRTAFVQWVQGERDAFARANPDPGRATIRRLNRVEYANAVRDLLALDIDVSHDLPQDNSGYGFDNIADVLSVSPTLVERYVAVAGKVARLAVGLGAPKPYETSYVVPKDGSIMNSGRPAYNERASDLLPLGSRGGAPSAITLAPRAHTRSAAGSTPTPITKAIASPPTRSRLE